MDFGERIMEVRKLLQDKQFNQAEEILLNMLNEGKTKVTEDENNTYFSFNTYTELIIFTRTFRLKKKNIIPDISYSQLYYYLGVTNIEMKNYGKALEYLNEGLSWNPIDIYLAFQKAAVYRMLGNLERYRAEIEKAHSYIYTSRGLAKYFRELGWYYAERKVYDLANALYTRSIAYEDSTMARNELKYIAQQENREVKFSTREEIERLFADYNIKGGFSTFTFNVILDEYNRLKNEERAKNIVNDLSKTLYDITLDKQYMIYVDLKDDETGTTIKVPYMWRILNKSEYEKENSTIAFIFVTENNVKVTITCLKIAREEELDELYKNVIEQLEENNIKVIKEYTMQRNRTIKQTFIDVKMENETNKRLFQNYFIVNGFLFCAAWEVVTYREPEEIYEGITKTLVMDAILSMHENKDESIDNENKVIKENNKYSNLALEDINLEYGESNVNEELINDLKSFSEKYIKVNNMDSFWNKLAENMFITLSIIELIENNKLTIDGVLELSKDISKSRELCKKNIEKLNFAEIKSSVDTLQADGNDKTLTSILEIIQTSLNKLKI